MIEQINGTCESDEDDSHDEAEADEIKQRLGESLTEDGDCSVITQQMQQLQLSDESDDSNHSQVQFVEINHGIKTHHFPYTVTNTNNTWRYVV